MSMADSRGASVKTRDKIKYAFALVLTLITVAAIAGLSYTKAQRRKVSAEEQFRIRQTVDIFGTNGRLPPKVQLPPEPAGFQSN